MIEMNLNINAIVNKILNNSSSDSSGRDIPATSFDWAKINLKTDVQIIITGSPKFGVGFGRLTSRKKNLQ